MRDSADGLYCVHTGGENIPSACVPLSHVRLCEAVNTLRNAFPQSAEQQSLV